MKARGCHSLALWLAASACVVAAPAAAQESESSRRARQLEVFERLLTETVHLHLTEEIESLQVQQDVVVQGDGEMVVTVDAAPVVRLGRMHAAHGTYVAGHGLLFSFEAPPVALMPRPLAVRFAEPFAVYEFRDADGNIQWAGRVIEFRTRMMEESLSELEALLERERAGAADPQRTAELLHEIEKLRQNLEVLQAKVAPAPAPPDAAPTDAAAPPAAAAEVAGAEAAEARVREPRHDVAAPAMFEFYRGMVAEQRHLGEEAEKHRERIAVVIREACIEALSQYGSVIKGLGDDERITVMIVPADAWGQLGESRSGEEVISVRYRDIRDLDDGKIDGKAFRARVVINDRLGTPIAIEQQ